MGLTIGITANKARCKALGIVSDQEILSKIESAVESSASSKNMECMVYCHNKMSFLGERALKDAGFHFRWEMIGDGDGSGDGYYHVSWTDSED